MSEDCLNLNVYTPANRTGRPLPVMFWIHGGGFSSGAGDAEDGSLIARTNNVVVVTINYRLGVFGFLDLPRLSKQGSGNYGLLDQQAALRWTQRNIGAFGGDASRVTIGGLSAGGHSVCAQLASPSARGLFSGAIIQSGGCPSYTVKQAVARGQKYATAAGCSATSADLTCLRAKPASDLQAAAKDFIGGLVTGPLPTSGTPELPVAPLKAVRTGRTANVPLLIGHARDEVLGWAGPFANATKDQYEKAVRIEFGDEADAVLAHYPFSAYGDAYTGAYAFGALWGDSSTFFGLGGCQYLKLTAQYAKRQPHTYYYEFNDPHPPTGRPSTGFDAGASHGSEKPYLLPSATSALLTPEQQQLSGEMVRYWGSFVKHGKPATPGIAAWPSYRAGKFMSLLPGGESRALKTGGYRRAGSAPSGTRSTTTGSPSTRTNSPRRQAFRSPDPASAKGPLLPGGGPFDLRGEALCVSAPCQARSCPPPAPCAGVPQPRRARPSGTSRTAASARRRRGPAAGAAPRGRSPGRGSSCSRAGG